MLLIIFILQIVGANDKINVGSRARLQLYQVPPRRITKRDQVEVGAPHLHFLRRDCIGFSIMSGLEN